MQFLFRNRKKFMLISQKVLNVVPRKACCDSDEMLAYCKPSDRQCLQYVALLVQTSSNVTRKLLSLWRQVVCSWKVRLGLNSLILTRDFRFLMGWSILKQKKNSVTVRWAGHVASIEEIRSGGETWEKETTLKPRRRGEDIIKIGLQEVGWWAWTGLI
jgi:hypothetical protein